MGALMITRKDNWPEILASEIAAADRPFVWGEWDCCLFAAHVVRAMTGEDFAKSFRGYRTKNDALKLLKQHGGVSGIASKFLPEIPTTFACRGDVVEIDDALGICIGQWSMFLTETGLVQLPTLDGVRAWSV